MDHLKIYQVRVTKTFLFQKSKFLKIGGNNCNFNPHIGQKQACQSHWEVQKCGPHQFLSLLFESGGEINLVTKHLTYVDCLIVVNLEY